MNFKRIAFLLLCIIFIGAVVPPKGGNKKQLKILLISDLNDSYGTVGYSSEVHDLIGRIKDIHPDLILCAGDMVAGQKRSLTPEQLDAMWEGFRKEVLDPIAELKIPFAFTVGNHDASPGFENDRAAAAKFWNENRGKTNLQYSDSSHFPYYYSFVSNNIFFISWDASSATVPEEVKTWMKKELTSPMAGKAASRIVLGHLPLYAIVESKNKPGEVIHQADEMREFLQGLKVDMYISGHQHSFYPAYKNDLLLLHTGCLGGGPRTLIGHQEEGYKAYAILEIPRKGGIKKAGITGFRALNHQPVNISLLPDSVTGFNGTVYKLQ